jgi:hypothetical protein
VDNTRIRQDELGQEPIPEDLIFADIYGIERDHEIGAKTTPSTDDLLNRLEELPVLLSEPKNRRFSILDCFWVSNEMDAFHPHLRNARIIVVNRHKRSPEPGPVPFLQQALYVFTKRDGTYFCAHSSREHGKLMVYEYQENAHQYSRKLQSADAEIIGQVRMVVRKLI